MQAPRFAFAILFLFASTAHAGIKEASVKIRIPSSGNCGSGTLVARDVDCLYGLTCGHAFNFDRTKIGKLFQIETEHYTGTAKLLDLSDQAADIALFCCARIPGTDIVPITDEVPDENCPFTLSGFPGAGQFKSVQGNLDGSNRWYADEAGKVPLYHFALSGVLSAGASGGSVVQNGKLYAVISAADNQNGSDSFYTCAYTSLYKFSQKERTNCFGGTCRKIRIIQRGRGTLPAPPKQPQVPAGQKKIFKEPIEEKPAVPQPDVPPPPKPEAANISQADIDALVSRITALEKSAKQPGPAGDPGPRGLPGPAGAGADPKELAALKDRLAKIEGTKIPLIVYDGQGKIKSHKAVPLGQPLELKFSQIK